MNLLNSKYKLHIVILTKDCVDILTQTIDSIIEKQLYIPDTFNNYIIYVADTGSTDDNKKKIRDYQKQHPNIEFRNIYFDGYHFARVNNHVIKNIIPKTKGRDDLVLFCNNDVKLLSDCLTDMVSLHDSHDDAGTIGCKLLFEDGTIQHAGQMIVKTPDGLMPTHRGLRQPTNNMNWTDAVVGNTGALALIKLQLLLDIGGLNEQYRYYFEDVELNIECLLQGKTNYYLGKSVAFHYESVSVGRESIDKRERLANDLNNVLRPYMNRNTDILKKFYETN